MVRILIAGLWHETNTFAADRTGLEAFEAYQWAEGEQLLSKFRGTGTEIGGFLEHAEARGWEVVPCFYAAAVPSAIVTENAFEALVERVVSRARGRVDGALLALHGAMVSESEPDCETELLRRVRKVWGPELPIAATFDIHANLSAELTRLADLFLGYDTYPHLDMRERGVEAARLLEEVIECRSRPVRAFRKLPLLTVPQAQGTDDLPMREVMEKVHDWERRPGLACASVAVGFPYADVGRVGVSVLAYSRDSVALAEDCVADLADTLWKARHAFVTDNISPQEAAIYVSNAAAGPVILVDAADNVGGGAPGDGTVLLRALIEAGVTGAVVMLADREAARLAAAASQGGEIELSMGGKHDRRHGQPVCERVRVLKITDGAFVYRGSYMTGLKVNPGVTVVVDCRGNEVVLTERKVMPFDAEPLRAVGIEPSTRRAIAVKSAIAWKAGYGDMARDVIYVDTPGICSSNLSQFRYSSVPRPIFPLDPI